MTNYIYPCSYSSFRLIFIYSKKLSYDDNLGFPGGSVVKKPPANAGEAGDAGLIPKSGRSPGGEHGNQPCLKSSMDKGAWQATVHGVTKSQTQLSDWAHDDNLRCLFNSIQF